MAWLVNVRPSTLSTSALEERMLKINHEENFGATKRSFKGDLFTHRGNNDLYYLLVPISQQTVGACHPGIRESNTFKAVEARLLSSFPQLKLSTQFAISHPPTLGIDSGGFE